MLHLTLRTPSPIPLEVDGITPDRLAGLTLAEIGRLSVQHGNRREELGDYFTISGSPSDGELQFRDTTFAVKGIGRGMTGGQVTVTHDAGMHAGAEMTGGTLTIAGSAHDWLGAQMRGGTILVRGSAGSQVGAAYRGHRRGMAGGGIFIHGDAGDEVGLLMRRGLIVVGVRCGMFAGASMIAGTLFVFGTLGPRAGAGMKRGTIVAAGGAVELPPSFTRTADFTPTFLSLYRDTWSRMDFPTAASRLRGQMQCYRGDLLHGGKGEVLIPDATRSSAGA